MDKTGKIRLTIVLVVAALVTFGFVLPNSGKKDITATTNNSPPNTLSHTALAENSASEKATSQSPVERSDDSVRVYLEPEPIGEMPDTDALPPDDFLETQAVEVYGSDHSGSDYEDNELAQKLRDETLAAHRADRVQLGQVGIGTQAETLAEKMGVNVEAIKDNGFVVVTLETPMPFDMFENSEIVGLNQPFYTDNYADNEFPNSTKVTVYAELDNGYPISMTGDVDYDFMNSMTSMLDEIQTQLASGNGPTSTQTEWNESLSTAAGVATADLRHRSVVLGFSTPYRQFSEQAEAIKQNLKFKAAEVVVSGYAPPIGVDGRMDDLKIFQYRTAYIQ